VECPENYRTGYRNKNEFTIGLNTFTQKPKVGFNVSDNSKNFHGVELGNSHEDSLTCPPQSFAIAKIVEALILESEVPVYEKFSTKGFWRNLVVRQSFST